MRRWLGPTDELGNDAGPGQELGDADDRQSDGHQPEVPGNEQTGKNEIAEQAKDAERDTATEQERHPRRGARPDLPPRQLRVDGVADVLATGIVG